MSEEQDTGPNLKDASTKEEKALKAIKRERSDSVTHDSAETEPPKKKKKTKKKKTASDFKRGEHLPNKNIKNKKVRGTLRKIEKEAAQATANAARAQILLTEEAGYLEAEENEKTTDFSQKDLLPHFDLQTAAKVFDLSLDQLGPYKLDYSRNGRHLLLCGSKGHVALLDWASKKLVTELFLNETCHDVKLVV